jgi:hypothetical protein
MLTLLKYLLAALVILAGALALDAAYNEYSSLLNRVVTAEEQLSTSRDELLGYSKYTDYIVKGKQSLAGEAKLLTAKMTEEVVWVEHVEKKLMFFKSSGALILNLSIEYAFGFDLAPDQYEIVATHSGLEIQLGKPIPLTRASISLKSWDIVSQSLLVDEKAASLDLLARLQPVFDAKARTLADSEAVRVLCERKLIDHLSQFLEKQPGVRFVPRISVSYRK